MRAPLRNSNSFKDKLNAVNQAVNFKTTELNIISGNTTSNYDHKTFIRIFYDDNKMMLVNSYCSCLHVINFIKEKLNLGRDDQIDLMDFEGNLKDIPTNSSKSYLISYIVPTSNYFILKIDKDQDTGEKKFYPMIIENKLNAMITKTLQNLNTGKLNTNRTNGTIKNKPREPLVKQGLSTPTSTSSSQSNLTQNVTGRKGSNKK